jgi:hypothetical protein
MSELYSNLEENLTSVLLAFNQTTIKFIRMFTAFIVIMCSVRGVHIR